MNNCKIWKLIFKVISLDIGSFYQPQLPFIRASIPLIRQLSGNLPGIDRFTQNLERLQRITPDDIRASEARERERELNPPTTPGNLNKTLLRWRILWIFC